jgi:hypothetical protein
MPDEPRPERRRHAPLTQDHLPPGTRPEDIDPDSEASPIPNERANEIPPRHDQDTHGADPISERRNLEGPEQNPQ